MCMYGAYSCGLKSMRLWVKHDHRQDVTNPFRSVSLTTRFPSLFPITTLRFTFLLMTRDTDPDVGFRLLARIWGSESGGDIDWVRCRGPSETLVPVVTDVSVERDELDSFQRVPWEDCPLFCFCSRPDGAFGLDGDAGGVIRLAASIASAQTVW